MLVTSIIFMQKSGFTAFLCFIYPVLFLINKFCESLHFLFCSSAILTHIKQCQTMRHKPNNDFFLHETKYLENVINFSLIFESTLWHVQTKA